MTVHKLLWTTSAEEVLHRLRSEATNPNAPVDPWPHAWPYASPMHAPTTHLPLYERKEQ